MVLPFRPRLQNQHLNRLITNQLQHLPPGAGGQCLTDSHLRIPASRARPISMTSSAPSQDSPFPPSNHPDLKNVFSEENKARAIAVLQQRSSGAGAKIVRMFAKQLSPRRTAAVLIPLCLNLKGEPCFCYTLRSLKLSKHSGEICFPGGAADPEDSDPIATALRETEEELNISRDGIDIWTAIHAMPTASSLMSVTPVVGLIKEPLDVDTLKVNPHEVEKAFAIPFQHLCDTKNWGHTQILGGVFSAPTYKNMKVYHPPGEYTRPDGLSSSEEDEGSANANAEKDVRLWGLTAILTHIMLEALLPNVYKRHIPQV